MVCSGDPTEFCGAGNRLELYSTTATRSTTTPPTPTATLAVKPTVGDYVFVGCQTEATNSRALSQDTYADDAMTLESCAAYCAGYIYFGAEYGRECYCGNSLNAGSVPASLGDCSMTCGGDPFAYCGAGNRLQFYRLASAPTETAATATITTATPTGTLSIQPTVSSYTYAGCWNEATGARALGAKSYDSAAGMTLEACAAFCTGYKYFGTEYASQCFCGNALHPTATSTDDDGAACSMPCSGNPYQFCGAGNLLSLYIDVSVVVPDGPSQPATVVVPDTLVEWTFEACRTEGAGGLRALAAASHVSGDMTLESCGAYCADYDYFGTEYGSECYCGDGFGQGSVVVGEGECGMVCAGDVTVLCGAGNRLSVYKQSA